MSTFRCPDCNSKIASKNYDDDFEMYECPRCEGMFTEGELVQNGAQSSAGGSTKPAKAVPQAKGKKRQQEREDDERLADEQIEQITKEAVKTEKEKHHRDEVKTGLVLNIIADEIEDIFEELGIKIDRLNAREYYAMNLYRPLIIKGVRAREQAVKHKLCKVHRS